VAKFRGWRWTNWRLEMTDYIGQFKTMMFCRIRLQVSFRSSCTFIREDAGEWRLACMNVQRCGEGGDGISLLLIQRNGSLTISLRASSGLFTRDNETQFRDKMVLYEVFQLKITQHLITLFFVNFSRRQTQRQTVPPIPPTPHSKLPSSALHLVLRIH
jgi:hypothetical protein